MIGKVSMADILAMRSAGTFKLLEHPDRLGHIVRLEPNKFRQFCKLKGIKGKGKKRFRKVLRENARAKLALADKQTQGGLVNVAQAPRS